jgi:methylated-DNA-protein-cysteine methyltransferase-like protein
MHITHNKIYDMVCRIPAGRVATYGQIARLIGYPRHARQIGYALAVIKGDRYVPWHRVINSKGKISPRGLDGNDDYQRVLLEDENIIFNAKGCISLKIFQWQPRPEK